MGRIGLYGGSFDPIHFGHLISARAVAEAIALEKVIFLPSATPPHKSGAKLAPALHRAEMVKLAIEGEELFSFSDADLIRTGPSYTIDTVSRFQAEYGPDVELHWIIGADSLAELTTWRRATELVDRCRIMTAVRPHSNNIPWNSMTQVLGAPRVEKLCAGMIGTPAIEVSSTEIRRRIRDRLSIRYLVPEPVREYIHANNLYLEAL